MAPSDLGRIAGEAAVSAILCLQHDDCHRYWGIDFAEMVSAASDLGLTVARHSVRDFDVEDQRRQLPTAIGLLAHLQTCGHRTYVHCTAGLSRAPLTVLGYLTLVERWNPTDAIGRIHQCRSEAVPAWEAYHGCVEDLTQRHRGAIERRAYELYESRRYSNADADWQHAVADVLRAELLATPPGGVCRPDFAA